MADDEMMKEIFPITQLLPPLIKKRVNALKKLQLESLNIEAKFFSDVYKMECDYHQQFKKLYDKREKIITGAIEPTDEEADFHIPGTDESNETEDEELIKELREKLSSTKLDPSSPGIPEFWLTIFKNVELLNEMIQPHDEPILRYLSDVQVNITEGKMGFELNFIFAANPYFNNTCLTKEYEMKCTPEESDPWSFEGPEIFKCKGCTIDWNKNMNVTLKTIKKRQKHKSKGAVRTVVKCVQNDSFFNFFNPPIVPDNGEIDEETQALLTSDFEIGHYIRDKIIPRAVLYYTGEALEDEFDEGDESSEEESDDFDNEENDEDEEDEEEEDDTDDGPEDAPSKNDNNSQNRNKKKNTNKNKNKSNAIQQPQECAQQ